MKAMKAQTAPAGSSTQGGRPAHKVALGLGWFSIGLGLAQSLMPQTMARAVGLQGKESLVRAFGFREILSGVGILMSRDPEPWIWSRVAGDALDLGALSMGMRRDNPQFTGSIVATLAVAQVTVVDYACASALARYRNEAERPRIDYHGRSGFASSTEEMRGAALSDFEIPREYRIPEALRPWTQGQRSSRVQEGRALNQP
jgi:hypothetical protein